MFDPCMVSLSNHQSPRSNVLPKYASARRFIARLATETFLIGLMTGFFNSDIAFNRPRRLDL
jgi:hypothetical protein